MNSSLDDEKKKNEDLEFKIEEDEILRSESNTESNTEELTRDELSLRHALNHDFMKLLQQKILEIVLYFQFHKKKIA